jgi:hypothetical protein
MQTKSVGQKYPRNCSRQFRQMFGRLLLPLASALLLGGCAGLGQPAQFTGPSAPAAVHTESWVYQGDQGELIHTDHYDIYTTIADPDIRQRIADVMEGALGEYQRIAPGVPLSNKPMQCFVFRNRQEWVYFTRQHTGVDSYIYLQINRGGYTVRDWYVAYNVGEAATLSVAAHEGWHQFVARNFTGRLPPFLEEGIATMFEDLEWDNDLPRWNLTMNRSRLQSLRRAVEGNYIYPLGELVQKHAGNVVSESGNHIDAFYAENWAFATFLWAAEDGKYRPAMRRLMSDIADGTVYDPTGVHKNKMIPWNPAGVKPMLEHYLGMNLDQIDGEYQKYIRKIAFDDYAAQWN